MVELFADDYRLPNPTCMRPESPPFGFLPRSVSGRVATGLLSTVLLPFAAAGLLAMAAEPAGPNPGWWAARAAFGQLLAGVLGLCVCGLAWAVSTPTWVEPLAWQQRRRLGWSLAAFYLSISAWAALAG